MPLDLTALGWSPRLSEAFAPHADQGLVPGRVALEHTHIYRVFTADGEWLARVSGRLRHRATARVDFPAVGDWVALEPAGSGGDARIRAVLPRSSRFSRRAAVVLWNTPDGIDGSSHHDPLASLTAAGFDLVSVMSPPQALARVAATLRRGDPADAIAWLALHTYGASIAIMRYRDFTNEALALADG